PSGRAGRLGQQLDDTHVGERIGLVAAQFTRDDQVVETRGTELLDQRLRQALLALDLVVMVANDRSQRSRCLNARLGVDIGGGKGGFPDGCCLAGGFAFFWARGRGERPATPRLTRKAPRLRSQRNRTLPANKPISP